MIKENGIYFVTCNTCDKLPYFKNPVCCDIWLENLKLTKQMKQFEIYAFSLHYNHFHLLLQPNTRIANINDIINSFKKNVANDINKIVFKTNQKTNNHSTLSLKFGNNNNIYQTIFKQNYFKWYNGILDFVICNDKIIKFYLNYILHNNKAHNLPSDWTYTSEYHKYLLDKLSVYQG